MTEPWNAVRATLRTQGVPDPAVHLPVDTDIPWEGALHVAEAQQRGWTISTVDYGRARLLLRRTTADEVVKALYAYLLTPLPAPSAMPDAERERLLTWAAPHVLDLASRASTPLTIDLPAGLLVDRVGALDGYLLYPTGTSFETRSLPPTVLGQPLHSFVTTAAIRVEAVVTPPWFGRAGGGLRLSVSEAGVGVRDLVREGQLAQLSQA
ncbi:TNT domain-containing protein [Microbacterium sp. AZCO]|uniref:TNT domain-containing protein n=1 Tax=Microbacterium sp. AZCO TaxID=3142976 RepID=UPI0031F3E5CD